MWSVQSQSIFQSEGKRSLHGLQDPTITSTGFSGTQDSSLTPAVADGHSESCSSQANAPVNGWSLRTLRLLQGEGAHICLAVSFKNGQEAAEGQLQKTVAQVVVVLCSLGKKQVLFQVMNHVLLDFGEVSLG